MLRIQQLEPESGGRGREEEEEELLCEAAEHRDEDSSVFLKPKKGGAGQRTTMAEWQGSFKCSRKLFSSWNQATPSRSKRRLDT